MVLGFVVGREKENFAVRRERKRERKRERERERKKKERKFLSFFLLNALPIVLGGKHKKNKKKATPFFLRSLFPKAIGLTRSKAAILAEAAGEP